MTTAEVATAFAAVAAAGACATAVIEALRDRRSRQPLLVGHALNVPDVPYAVLRVTNAGLGPAVSPAFIGVDHGVGYGGHLAAGLLAPGESRLVHLNMSRFRDQTMTFILTCRGIDGRLYWTRGDEKHGAKRVGDHVWPTPESVFHNHYPEVQLSDQLTTGREERFPSERPRQS